MSAEHGKRGKEAGRRRPATDGQKFILALSVIVSTGFIVAIWAFLLPSQLAGQQLFSQEEVDRWLLIQDTQREGAGDLMQVIDALGAQLEALDTVEVPALAAPRREPLLDRAEIERLRARIEAASAAGHLNDDAE